MSEASAIPARPLPRRGGSNPSSRARTAALALKRGRPRRAASTSRSITRPPGPLPSKVSGSIPCLMATFRARGLIPAPDPADAKCDGSEFVTSVAGPGGFAGPGLEEGSGSAAGGAEGSAPAGRRSSTFSPSSPMAATFAKTGTSSSASQKSARTFPEAVDSRSKLALSVSMTARTSPSATSCPTSTFHSVRMQLSTDCPWRGIMIGVAMVIFSFFLACKVSGHPDFRTQFS